MCKRECVPLDFPLVLLGLELVLRRPPARLGSAGLLAYFAPAPLGTAAQRLGPAPDATAGGGVSVSTAGEEEREGEGERYALAACRPERAARRHPSSRRRVPATPAACRPDIRTRVRGSGLRLREQVGESWRLRRKEDADFRRQRTYLPNLHATVFVAIGS